MTKAEIKHLDRLRAQADALVASLVEKLSGVDFGSDEAYRLDQLVDKAGSRAERRRLACIAAHGEVTRIPTDVSLGYISVDGVVRQCLSGPGRELPSDFKEWANQSLNCAHRAGHSAD